MGRNLSCLEIPSVNVALSSPPPSPPQQPEQAEGGELEVITRREGDTAVVSIADRGPGLGPDVESRLFEPYFTTKEKGTGLGLPIALRIVSDHCGSIRAENREGSGARVVIQLPLNGPPPA